MKRYLATIILVLVGVLLLAACGQAAMAPAPDRAAPAEEAPRSESRPVRYKLQRPATPLPRKRHCRQG